VLSNLFSSTTIPALEQVAIFSQQRHQVLASNIANMDTPGYRTRDLDQKQFQQNLASAIQSRDSQGSDVAAVTAAGRKNPFDQVRKELNGIMYHDESNVGLEQQVAEITKNQMQHNLAVTILTSQFRLLQTAISERA
jgi:flagellar basal-body rod protein FlgB